MKNRFGLLACGILCLFASAAMAQQPPGCVQVIYAAPSCDTLDSRCVAVTLSNDVETHFWAPAATWDNLRDVNFPEWKQLVIRVIHLQGSNYNLVEFADFQISTLTRTGEAFMVVEIHPGPNEAVMSLFREDGSQTIQDPLEANTFEASAGGSQALLNGHPLIPKTPHDIRVQAAFGLPVPSCPPP